ncbi:UDP-2,3-diacylglucosamine hydrolase [Flexibacter flexilis DSM 6793]|uniref:UDP-2,3-diacylglucosamine hydrolase n=1 Tax=Flexibacter flexilis DSM 6793 TaxID=927664 RepID=A0A1I1KF78_9BACT|nr:UDP-2,3-diacylglucosamine diphosphatase [Flexibacter flexilis]SFC59467.1 UDP-2,3-diacylglucosamine hydrolase [Flexibacter flexilis DSM 6793]
MIPTINQLPEGKKIFFASDFHLGSPTHEKSRRREDRIVRWLDWAAPQAAAIVLVGDIFDFWFEYKHVIPKGFIRFQGKLAQLTDAGIPVYVFTGNHDMWLFDYFPKELNIPVFRAPQTWQVGDKKLYVGHGDGLGSGDYTYKLLKIAFDSKVCQWLFSWIHPNVGMGIADAWSKSSRSHNDKKGTDEHFLGEGEWLWQYCRDFHLQNPHDYYIFGHRHLALQLPVSQHAQYINLGEWFNTYSFGKFDGKQMNLYTFSEDGKVEPLMLNQV